MYNYFQINRDFFSEWKHLSLALVLDDTMVRILSKLMDIFNLV